jgi:ligand-binding sensor domain-containing protein
MNQIRILLIDRSGDLWAGGPAGLVHWNPDTGVPTVYATGVQHEYTNVVALVQASDGAIWVGTFGNGIGIFDGTKWQPLNTENGLPGNYVISLTKTGSGEMWADLKKMPYSADDGQDYYFGRFDGTQWIEEVGGGFNWVLASPNDSVVGAFNFPSVRYPISEVGTYAGQSWNQEIYLAHEHIDAITIAPDSVIWFATSNHLFRYVGRTVHKTIPPWAAEDFNSSVTSIAVTEDGTAWFGFSHASFLEYPCGSSNEESDQEQGVYRYDGATWTHFTTEDGLVDNKICAIAVDPSGNVCFGSFDRGISCFDGVNWKTYQIP